MTRKFRRVLKVRNGNGSASSAPASVSSSCENVSTTPAEPLPQAAQSLSLESLVLKNISKCSSATTIVDEGGDCRPEVIYSSSTSTEGPSQDEGADGRVRNRNLEQISEEHNNDGPGSEKGLLLIVGPPKFTRKFLQSFKASSNYNILNFAAIPEMRVEDAMRWRDDNLVGILYVVEDANPKALTKIDETLSILSEKYSMSMDSIDFILAKEARNMPENRPSSAPNKKGPLTISAFDILSFTQKYNRHFTTVVLGDGDLDHELKAVLGMVLRRFFMGSSTSTEP